MIAELGTRALAPGPGASPLLHLHGAIITPSGFIPRGTIVVSDAKIQAVHEEVVPAVGDAIDAETGGLLCPGFVDTHNHAPYAAFHRWKQPARYFSSRFDWRGKTRCGVIVQPQPDDYYLSQIARPFKVMTADPAMLPNFIFYGQVRGLIGGATTMVIDADLDPGKLVSLPGFARDPSDWPGRIWGILDIGCLMNEELRQELVAELQQGKARLLVHAGEGTDLFSRGEFLTLVNKGLLTPATSIIHALALLEEDWQKVRQQRASVIWSPVSNHRLYGRSIDIGQVLGAGIRVALAPDWTVTGSSTVLDELAFVRSRYGWISHEHLLQMVTEAPADLMGMSGLGRLVPGALADILVFPADGVVDRATAATRVVGSSHQDIRLALVGGIAIYGLPELVNPLAVGPVEQIALPLPSGGTATRALYVAGGVTYADAVGTLARLLAANQLTLAPLWEGG